MLDRISNLFPKVDDSNEFYKWLVLINVMVGTFMAILDATIVNVALSKIMNTFGTSIDIIEWVLTAYMLAMSVMLPASGWIADHFGYKKTYILALALFTFGSLLCAFSWNENILIAFRVIQGFGAGLLMPVGMAIITRTFPPEKRGLALGFWGISAAASVSLGPVIGGYLVDNFNWNAIFNVNVPIGAAGIIATYIIQKKFKSAKTISFDFIGTISMTVFLTCLLLALACGNSAWNTGGWTSNFIITCFVFSFISFVIFVYTELTIEHPLIDLRLLKNFNFTMTNIILFIFGFGMFGSTFLLPLYLINAIGFTSFQAGLFFLPVGMLQALFSPVSGIISDKLNPKIPAFAGLIFLGLGLYTSSFITMFSGNDYVTNPMILRGIGMGLVFSPLTNLAVSSIPHDKLAQASGLLNVIRQIGGSFGIAVFGTLLNRQTTFHLSIFGQAVDRYSPAFQNVMSNMKYIVQQSGGKPLPESAAQSGALIAQNVANQAFVQAICDDFILAGIITIICVLPLLITKNLNHSAKGKSRSKNMD